MSKLKACPFCGGTDVLSERDGVHCEGCGARVGEVAAWNRREPDWQELAREMACIAAEQRLPYTCESCGHKTDKPCPKDALGLCEAQRWYPTEVIVAMAVKAGLLEG